MEISVFNVNSVERGVWSESALFSKCFQVLPDKYMLRLEMKADTLAPFWWH